MCGIGQTVRGEDRPVNVEHILAGKGREVRTIEPEATVSDALHRMHDERVGALVVSPDGVRIAGIVSDRGVMDALATHGTAVLGSSVGSVMTRDVFTCSRDDRVSGIMALMTKRRIRHVPVVEGDGRLCGIVSIGDVVKQRLDEIQGEADALREYVTSAM
jgi:CBS domain-containing protein